MAIITRAQAKKKLEKLSPDSPKRDCPVCGDHIYDSDDSWEYVKTKTGSEIFIHTFCVKHWGIRSFEGGDEEAQEEARA